MKGQASRRRRALRQENYVPKVRNVEGKPLFLIETLTETRGHALRRASGSFCLCPGPSKD